MSPALTGLHPGYGERFLHEARIIAYDGQGVTPHPLPADGLATVNAPPEHLRRMIGAFRDGGGTGRLVLQVHLSWAPTDEEALRIDGIYDYMANPINEGPLVETTSNMSAQAGLSFPIWRDRRVPEPRRSDPHVPRGTSPTPHPARTPDRSPAHRPR